MSYLWAQGLRPSCSMKDPIREGEMLDSILQDLSVCITWEVHLSRADRKNEKQELGDREALSMSIGLSGLCPPVISANLAC